MEVQAPQLMQNSDGWRKGVVTRRLMPRPSNDSAPIFITSSQSRTHMPQRMQPPLLTKLLGAPSAEAMRISSRIWQAPQVRQGLFSPRGRSNRHSPTPTS